MTEADHERAIVAGGCFWCIEAVFKEVTGIESATSGYTGGTVDDPTYEDVCRGTTGHAEAVELTYDPKVIRFEEILDIFFLVHDPTTKNRQGPDVGSQYRSALFPVDDEQRRIAEAYIDELDSMGAYDDPIVTEVEPLTTFYEAEPYHRDFYERNPAHAYCIYNVEPKLKKLRQTFEAKVKSAE